MPGFPRAGALTPNTHAPALPAARIRGEAFLATTVLRGRLQRIARAEGSHALAAERELLAVACPRAVPFLSAMDDTLIEDDELFCEWLHAQLTRLSRAARSA